jgi:hypothetical protein
VQGRNSLVLSCAAGKVVAVSLLEAMVPVKHRKQSMGVLNGLIFANMFAFLRGHFFDKGN